MKHFLLPHAVFAIFLLGPGALPAADAVGTSLTLSQCCSLALDRSELVRAQEQRRVQAEERYRQARGGLLPSAWFEASASARDDAGGSLAASGSFARLAFSQPLFTGFRNTGAVAVAESDRRREDLQMRTVVRRLNADVARAFFTLGQVEADLRNVQENIKLLRDRTRELNERVRLGKSRESEVLLVESRISALKAQEEQLSGDRRVAAGTLALLTGLESAGIRIEDDLAAVKTAGSLADALKATERRSDIDILREEVAARGLRSAVARGALLPSVGLDGSWYVSRNGSLAGADWDVLLSLEIPLFQGGVQRSRVREERSRQTEAAEQLALLEREVKTELTSLHDALSSSIRQTAALRDAYVRAEKSYQLQLREYRLGLVNNLDVIQSMTALLEIKGSLDRAEIRVKQNKVLFDIAMEKT